MNIFISGSRKGNIYEQIAEDIQKEILNQRLHKGESLPSIRSLANELEVSMITVKKAYDLLEEKKMIETLPGKGSFVTGQNAKTIQEEGRKTIQEQLFSVFETAAQFGITKEELIEMIQIM